MDSFVETCRGHCTGLLKNSRCQDFPFHNFKHTLDVYKNATQIAKAETLSEESLKTLQIAALFHDTGYAEVYKGHEELSALKAKAFLIENNVPQKVVKEVLKCIYATKMPQNPHSHLEKIICDADLAHLGKPGFFEKSKDLRREWEQQLAKHFTDEEWRKNTLKFLEGHRFFTGYAQKKFAPQKAQNQKDLRKKA